jgi:hypothetical protein
MGDRLTAPRDASDATAQGPRDASDATVQAVDAKLAAEIAERRFQQGGRGLAQQTRLERQSAPINLWWPKVAPLPAA